MPIFEYTCPQCSLTHDHLVLSPQPTPATHECPRCKNQATKKDFSRVALARSGMDNAPVDHFIGADAERRWNDINTRQEQRDNVRKASGTVGLTMTGRNDFQPLSSEKIGLRTSLNEAIATSGGFRDDG